jgi:hypothetical protein
MSKFEQQRQELLDSLPEVCRTECSIAKIAIFNLIEGEIPLEGVGEKLSECEAEPMVIGGCSTKKTVCRHPGSGDSEVFLDQVDNLYNYVQE